MERIMAIVAAQRICMSIAFDGEGVRDGFQMVRFPAGGKPGPIRLAAGCFTWPVPGSRSLRDLRAGSACHWTYSGCSS